MIIKEYFDINKLRRTLDIDISELADLTKSEIRDILDASQDNTKIHGIYNTINSINLHK